MFDSAQEVGARPQKSKGASAVKLLRPLKLSRKVFRLPGSIWGEDNPAVARRQSNSYSILVQICGQVCKIRWQAQQSCHVHFPVLSVKG
jgi:hypothetical protein